MILYRVVFVFPFFLDRDFSKQKVWFICGAFSYVKNMPCILSVLFVCFILFVCSQMISAHPKIFTHLEKCKEKGYEQQITKIPSTPNKSFFFFFFFFFFLVFRAAPATYGNSQARCWIRATVASLCHSHNNSGSKWHLQPIPQPHGHARSPTHWARPKIKPASA